MEFYVSQTSLLISAPFSRHLVEQGGIDPTVEFVHIGGVNAVLETIVLRVQSLDCRGVIASLVGVAL